MSFSQNAHTQPAVLVSTSPYTSQTLNDTAHGMVHSMSPFTSNSITAHLHFQRIHRCTSSPDLSMQWHYSGRRRCEHLICWAQKPRRIAGCRSEPPLNNPCCSDMESAGHHMSQPEHLPLFQFLQGCPPHMQHAMCSTLERHRIVQ